MLNLLDLIPGQRLRLRSGAICEVLENMGDGIWVQARVVANPTKPSDVGSEELVHCEEVAGLDEDSQPGGHTA